MKTILITGSTDGIGKLTAIQLAKQGHQVILHGRTRSKLQKVKEEVAKASNSSSIETVLADFSKLDDVKEMSAELKARFSQLDVLINNAGVFLSPKPKTDEGLDMRFAVNYFAPLLLSNELLPLLINSAQPRVINLSSAAQARIDMEALNGGKKISDQEAYAQSKLALTMWNMHFAEQHPGITSIAVNPGSLLNTKMVQEAYGQFWSSPTKGRDILCSLALEDEFSAASGKYFDNDQGDPRGVFSEAHADAYNKELISKLMLNTKNIFTPILKA